MEIIQAVRTRIVQHKNSERLAYINKVKEKTTRAAEIENLSLRVKRAATARAVIVSWKTG